MKTCLNIWLAVVLLSLASCSKNLLDEPKATKGNAKFIGYIAVGGSETAGFADGALYRSAQQNSYPALLAQQFSKTSTISFTQALLGSDSGIAFFNGQPVAKLQLGYFHFSCNSDSMLIPVRKPVAPSFDGFFAPSTYSNLGVPGLRASDVLNNNLSQTNVFYRRVNGDTALNFINVIRRGPPSFFTVWLGTQDILDYAMAGGQPSMIPSAGSFQVALDSVLDALTVDTTAGGVIATIPDVTEFPYFNAIAYNALPLNDGLAATLNNVYASSGLHFQAGANAFVISDPSSASGIRQLTADEKILLTTPLDSIRCNLLGSLYPMPANNVLDASEVARIQQATNDYNQVIKAAAAARGIPLLDLHALYHSLKSGVQYNGMLFTNILVTGYFFSLDGLNPSFRGSAIIANEFIKKINSSYKSTVPTLDPTTFSGPLFP